MSKPTTKEKLEWIDRILWDFQTKGFTTTTVTVSESHIVLALRALILAVETWSNLSFDIVRDYWTNPEKAEATAFKLAKEIRDFGERD